jgi:hypothetical protein
MPADRTAAAAMAVDTRLRAIGRAAALPADVRIGDNVARRRRPPAEQVEDP